MGVLYVIIDILLTFLKVIVVSTVLGAVFGLITAIKSDKKD